MNPYNDLNYYFKQLQRRLSKLLYSGLFLYGGNVCIVLQSIIQKLKNEIILLQYVQRNYPELHVHIFNWQFIRKFAPMKITRSTGYIRLLYNSHRHYVQL